MALQFNKKDTRAIWLRADHWRSPSAIAAPLLLVALTACATSRPSPEPDPLLGKPQRPLIFVPGILGSKLVHEDSGKSAWGGGFDVFLPRDEAYELVLPIPARDREEKAGHDLVPTTVVDEVRLALYRRKVYRRLADFFKGRGYRLGSLEDPQPGENFFMFSYDFRYSNQDAVQRLRAALDHLRRVRGVAELEFDLLCQSNGGYVCRYLMRYGAEFDPVFGDEKVAVGPPKGLVPRRLALAGTANAGGLRILHELRDGRFFVKGIGRYFSPELLFAMRPLFDDLPWSENPADVDAGAAQGGEGEASEAEDAEAGWHIFIDRDGKPMAVDLYSAEHWVRYDLSVFGNRAEQRLERPAARALFGDTEDRVHYLKQRLQSARELQEKLRAVDTVAQDVQLLMVQGRDQSTPRRAVLVETEDGWQTIFAGDRAAETLSRSVRDLLTEPGDGHATLASQAALSPSERRWLVDKTVYAIGSHFDLILDPLALQVLADFFLGLAPESWSER